VVDREDESEGEGEVKREVGERMGAGKGKRISEVKIKVRDGG
jgi:hypothetical protein